MSTVEQNHSGNGDNVSGDKIYKIVKALAPEDLVGPLERVFESLRKRDSGTAKIQMDMLRAMTHKEHESVALLDVIAIYGGLIDESDHASAWGTVSNTAATTQSATVKDVCLAALLRLSHGTEREQAAKTHYLAEKTAGPYAAEIYLSHYADEEYIIGASEQFLISEAELTGIVIGSLRLELISLANAMALRLTRDYPSYNARVLELFARAYALNPEIADRHLWLCTPELKQKVDQLTEQVLELIRISSDDKRLYNIACPVFEAYRGMAPPTLLEALQKNINVWEESHASVAAAIKAASGNEEFISQRQRDILAAKNNLRQRVSWCNNFLSSGECQLEDIFAFYRLASDIEIDEWLSRSPAIDNLSEVEKGLVILLGYSFREIKSNSANPKRKHQLADQSDRFIETWGAELTNLSPELIFELAENLIISGLPDKALRFTSRLVPDNALWPSPFILTYLRCLLEAQQYITFDDEVNKISEPETSISILNFQSLKAERMGDIDAAIAISDQILIRAPEVPYSWYRGCFLRARHQSVAHQRDFQKTIPETILKNYSPDALSILYFLTLAGNFKQAESHWVEWFIENPTARAKEFVNFYFGLTAGNKHRPQIVTSPHLSQCVAAFHFEKDGTSMIRLIVNDHQADNEFTLKASSQLAQLLHRSTVGCSKELNMASYKLLEKLDPYVACLRIALHLRAIQNDGSDCFAMLQIPSDQEELVPYLERKLGPSFDRRHQIERPDLPLYIHGYFAHSDNAFKSAMNCWSDSSIEKKPLFSQGNDKPNAVVLDAYGIAYLAVTDLAQHVLDIGIKFILPAATKEALHSWLEEISHEDFMLVGINQNGKLFRTTAEDIKASNAHSLRALRFILENASVEYPKPHNIPLEIFSIRDGIDLTVYHAMQLSVANRIPWLSMDGVFASLHHSNHHEIANTHEIVHRAIKSKPFEFEHRRHGLLLFATGAISLPITYDDLNQLAANPNGLAAFILFKIINNYGKQIFESHEKLRLLLRLILLQLHASYRSGNSRTALLPPYSPGVSYTKHVFNHGISLFLENYDLGNSESRLATALDYMGRRCGLDNQFLRHLVGHFVEFAEGHFMDFETIKAFLSATTSE